MLHVLLESALRSLVLGIFIGAGLKLLRVRSAQLQMTVWTVVLIAALFMPVLMQWAVIRLPSGIPLPAYVSELAPELPRVPGTFEPTVEPTAEPTALAQASPVPPPSEAGRAPIPWLTVLHVLYFLGAAVLMVRLIIGLVMSARVVRTSQPILEGRAPGRDVRVSHDISIPMTFGRIIVLPNDYGAWSAAKLEAVLAHERAHAAHWHYYTLLLSRIHRIIFWFSPFSWWLHWQLADLAEMASDDEALVEVGDRSLYAEVLLSIAEVRAHGTLGVAMARRATISGRVERVLAPATPFVRMSPRQRLVVIMGFAPLAMIAACSIVQTQDGLAQMYREREKSLDPQQLAKFAGPYEFEEGQFLIIAREGDNFTGTFVGRWGLFVEFVPVDPVVFDADGSGNIAGLMLRARGIERLRFSFDTQGNVTGLVVLDRDGREQPARRVAATAVKNAQALAQRATQSPGTAEAVRRFISAMQAGEPNYSEMNSTVAAEQRRRASTDVPKMRSLGSLWDFQFVRVSPRGADIYQVFFERGVAMFAVLPPTSEGKIAGLGWLVAPYRDPPPPPNLPDPSVLQRIERGKPSPGTEAALRRQIEALANGQPDYAAMTPELAAAVRARLGGASGVIKGWGQLKSITFREIGAPAGAEIYDLHFEHADAVGHISPLTSDGKIALLRFANSAGRFSPW